VISAIQQLGGWQRRSWAIFFGICAAAALPPIYLLPLLFPSFTGLFLLAYASPTHRQAFLDGWWWGLGYFTAGLYWICISLYVEPEKFAWLTPFALFGLPSILAIYVGLVTCLIPRSIRKPPLFSYLIFAGLWVFFEYIRTHLFSGFPWNPIGLVWSASDITLQLASVIGSYGLSWLTAIFATLPVFFFLEKRIWFPLCTGLIIVVLFLGFGWWQLGHYPTEYTDVKIRIVQANIAQSLKWDPKSEFANLKKYADLTRSPGLDSVQLVIWPEASVPFYMEQDSILSQNLGSLLPKHALLLTGGLRGIGTKDNWKAWNSLFAIDEKGHIVTQYDKHHLVPFGEFIPLRHILPLENIAGGLGDFSRGPGPGTLFINNYPPFSPLICYEAIFSDEATDNTRKATWLLNITNDAWFGISSGPYQHLQMARMRAVEQGLPLIRAANTGISASFDSMGRLLASLHLGETDIMDVELPKANQSIFSRYSTFPILFIIAGSIVLWLLGYKKH
jgi:apolipoprotein N-acyltransferase